MKILINKNTDTNTFRYRQVIKRLLNNKGIVILKQDKGRGVVILSGSKYIEKCLSIVNSSQFLQVDKDPTTSIERKVQRTLTKIKDKIPAYFIQKSIQLEHHLVEFMAPLSYAKLKTTEL